MDKDSQRKLEYIYKYVTYPLEGKSFIIEVLDNFRECDYKLILSNKHYLIYDSIFKTYNPLENPIELINDLLLSNDLDNLIIAREMVKELVKDG